MFLEKYHIIKNYLNSCIQISGNQIKQFHGLDVGAGYGEIMEAILSLTNNESQVEGLEPMNPKAKVAKQMGLTIHSCYLKKIWIKNMILFL